MAVKGGCKGILVENCYFAYGHGCSIGSIRDSGVQDVMLRNITFVGTENGARIKTWQGGTALVQNISYVGLRIERLIKQGFWYSKLCKFFKKFVSRHNALFSKYGVSVRTHVHEGICIPLVVKHELSKHITTSRGHST